MILFKILLVLMIFFIIYDKLTQSYKTKYPTILYFGLKGSGKTTILTSIALKWLKAGKTVYSNYALPGCIIYDPRRLGEFYPEPDSLIICDEIALAFNNRNYQDFPKSVNEFITYQRQHRCTFICATQIFDSFDKKIRGQLDQLYQVKKIARVFVVARQIIKDIKPTQDETDIQGTYKYAGLLVGTKIRFIPRYTEYYKSFNPPKLPLIYQQKLPISDDQVKHLSGRNWLIDEVNKSISKGRALLKRFPIEMKEKKRKCVERILSVRSRKPKV